MKPEQVGLAAHVETASDSKRNPPADGPRRTARGTEAVVATAFPAATEAAMMMLRAGGNAVDAAAAAAWALSVCEPSGSGLGGQTTILIRFPDGRTTVMDGHSSAPASLTRRDVSRTEQRYGFRSCTIPSTVATLGAAQESHGTLPLSTVIAPAIALAESGFPVTRLLRRHIKWCRSSLADSEFTRGRFLRNGHPPQRGAILRQPELARTLGRLASHGCEDFYRGEIARTIALDMREQGGLITEADLSGCDLPVIRDSISIPYRGHEVLSVPPPGGGLQLLLALRTLEHLDLPERPDPILWVGAIARITRSVFQERERWPIRPERLSPSFMRWLIGEERAKELATEILAGADHSNPPEAEGPGDTTHLCVADAAGMIVSLTQSVQSLFGAKVANRHLGFFYNNYLCTCPRYRHPSRLRGGAAPQSNVAPTIVLGRPIAGGAREPVLAIGAAGSRRITSSVLQVLANVLHRGMPLEEAMDAPRVHATTSGRVMIERTAAGREVQESLARGFRSIDVKAPRSYAMGGVQAIGRDADSRMWVGCADPRREGACDAI